MTTTVAVRCSNEDCWKWFEPEAPEETPVPADDAPTFRRAPASEAVCPHCHTRQAVPIMDNWGRTAD